MRLELRTQVCCTDDAFGELADLVIDPAQTRVTHLVVEPHHEHRLARLVPVQLAQSRNDPEPLISLACTLHEVTRLPRVQEFAFLRIGEPIVNDSNWDVGVQDMLAAPACDGPGLGPVLGRYDPHVSFNYDVIPRGDVELRDSSRVKSADGHRLGDVHGVVLDEEHQITSVLVRQGLLWNRHEIAVPIEYVERVATDEVTIAAIPPGVGPGI